MAVAADRQWSSSLLASFWQANLGYGLALFFYRDSNARTLAKEAGDPIETGIGYEARLWIELLMPGAVDTVIGKGYVSRHVAPALDAGLPRDLP